MFELEVTVKNRQGMHARPASLLVELANKFNCQIMIRKDEVEVNGKSIMGVLMLAASQGEHLRLQARGHCQNEEEKALAAIATLFENKFYED
jgi:phosphocarrier protein HPr